MRMNLPIFVRIKNCMKVAHLVMAHKNPEQLLRLVERLCHPQCDIYIHLDKKIAIDDFRPLERLSRVTLLTTRTDCHWGGYSLLAGMLNALEAVVASSGYSHINLLSAQDYPLVSPGYWINFLHGHQGVSFISYAGKDDQAWNAAAKARYMRYHFVDLKLPGKYFFQNLVNKVMPGRTFPLPRFFGGNKGTWWTLSGDCAAYLVETYRTDRALMRFLKYTWAPDEFAIPSMIMNSPFAVKTINDNYRYIDWSEGNVHPKILGVADFEKMVESKMFFARKFDMDVDSKVLDKIDQYARTV